MAGCFSEKAAQLILRKEMECKQGQFVPGAAPTFFTLFELQYGI